MILSTKSSTVRLLLHCWERISVKILLMLWLLVTYSILFPGHWKNIYIAFSGKFPVFSSITMSIHVNIKLKGMISSKYQLVMLLIWSNWANPFSSHHFLTVRLNSYLFILFSLVLYYFILPSKECIYIYVFTFMCIYRNSTRQLYNLCWIEWKRWPKNSWKLNLSYTHAESF